MWLALGAPAEFNELAILALPWRYPGAVDRRRRGPATIEGIIDNADTSGINATMGECIAI